MTQSLCWALILSTILLTKWQTSFVSDHPKWAEPLGLNEWEGDKRYVCHTHQNRKHVIKLWTHIWSRAQLVAGQLIHSSCPHWSSWQQRGNLRESATLHRSPILTKLVCWLTTIGSKPIEKRWIRWQLYSNYHNKVCWCITILMYWQASLAHMHKHWIARIIYTEQFLVKSKTNSWAKLT